MDEEGRCLREHRRLALKNPRRTKMVRIPTDPVSSTARSYQCTEKPQLRRRRALSLRSFDKDMLKQIHFKKLVRPWLEDFTGPWSKLQLSKNTQEALSIADIPDPAERHQSRRSTKTL